MKNKNDAIKADILHFFQTDLFYSEVIPANLDPHLNLMDSGILDSMGILNFIIYLEKKYQINIGIEDLNEGNFSSIEKVADFLLKRCKT